jgi:hypothetical protein
VSSAERLARNEQLFSEVNERIAQLASVFESSERIPFVCECAFLDCTVTIPLTLSQYCALRDLDGCYAVKRGHELGPHVETVVDEHGDVLIVRKHAEPDAP